MTTKKERPILFSGPMVRAILSGEKTQTRRVIKPQYPTSAIKCPYGVAGDLLWVRETFAENDVLPLSARPPGEYIYRADSVHDMPRRVSRIMLEITGIGVERVQDISEADAKAEGFSGIKEFLGLWNDINAKRGYGWGVNPFVWVVSFRRIETK